MGLISGTALAIGAGVAAAGGAIAGAIPKKSTTTVDAGQATDRETNALTQQDNMYSQLQGLTKMGPDGSDVAAATGASRDLGSMLQQYSQSGGMPGQQDIQTANQFAGDIFAPQRTQLQQSFTQQTTDANRQSAMMGRSVDDPILQAKLRTGMMNQEAMLNSQQGAFGAQTAMAMPQQRLQYAGMRADVMGNLATQAFQNRAALLQTGAGIAGAERQFRLATATRQNESGGGLGGAIEGFMGGLGAAGKMFGAGGAFAGGMGSMAGAGAGQMTSQLGNGTANTYNLA